MNRKKFDIWMNSINNKYLEESAMPSRKNKTFRTVILATAACLVLAATGLIFRHGMLQDNQPDNTQQLAENTVPTLAPTIIPTTEPSDNIIREYFVKSGANYTMLSCETAEPLDISGMETAEAEPLVWYAGGLEIKLCSTKDMAWASWYDTNTSTQWCLTAEASTLALLTTASDIVKELGYNVSVAPENATDITYDAFLLNDLTVAETTFLLDDVRYSYRMASTYEIAFPFADISGTGTNYNTHITTEVGWCPAEIYYDENGYGKIIWFDIAPGLLYSLSMETNSSEEVLLSLAQKLFSPAQNDAD